MKSQEWILVQLVLFKNYCVSYKDSKYIFILQKLKIRGVSFDLIKNWDFELAGKNLILFQTYKRKLDIKLNNNLKDRDR